MSEKIENKVAVITGGTTGIGKDVASKLAKHSIAVVLAGRNRQRGESVAAELVKTGAQALFVQANVGVEQDVKNLMMKQTINAFGDRLPI